MTRQARRPKYNKEMVEKLLKLAKAKPVATFETSEELMAYLDELADDGERSNTGGKDG